MDSSAVYSPQGRAVIETSAQVAGALVESWVGCYQHQITCAAQLRGDPSHARTVLFTILWLVVAVFSGLMLHGFLDDTQEWLREMETPKDWESYVFPGFAFIDFATAAARTLRTGERTRPLIVAALAVPIGAFVNVYNRAPLLRNAPAVPPPRRGEEAA